MWLVPEYTSDPAEACTAFSTVPSANDPVSYLDNVKDVAVPQKITEVGLFRTSATAAYSFSAIRPFNQIGPRLEEMAESGHLYLVWNTGE